MHGPDAMARATEALGNAEWRVAADHFEHAIRDSGTPEALAGLGDALFLLGETRASVQYRERAYLEFRRAGDVEGAAESAFWLCLVNGSALGNVIAAQGWHARAVTVLGDRDAPVLRAWIDYCGAALTNDSETGRRLLETALSIGRTTGDRDLELSALAELGVVRVKLGEVSAGLRCVDEAMASVIGGEGTEIFTLVLSACSMLTVCELLGDVGRATAWTSAVDALMEAQNGCPYVFAECRIVHGRMLTIAGDWPEAELELTRAVAVSEGAFPGMKLRALASLAQLRTRQGRLEEASAMLEWASTSRRTALAQAELALRQGQPDATVALVERWLRAVPGTVEPPLHAGDLGLSVEMSDARALQVVAHLAAGDVASAAAAAAFLDAAESVGGHPLAVAHAALARGRIALAREETDAAVGQLEIAVERFDELGIPLETARARVELARALHAAHPVLATTEARAALDSFDRLGARGDADVAAELLRTWGTAGRHVPRSSARLTEREQEVLVLLSRGLTNPEIAVRLHIARKTAEHHVSSILTKLGARNRAEAVGQAMGVRAEGT
jgi:DNA-binding CsgD family transcriptional regulator/tetratricopeptide (TPR) repeat protein